MAAASAGLSVAIVSICKVLLLVSTLIVLLRGQKSSMQGASWQTLWTPRLILVILFVFAGSLLWTSAPVAQAFGTMGKYGKFLVVPALLMMLQTQKDATFALCAFVGAQVFLLICTWFLYFHVPLVWATSNTATTSYAVFSSYLDQGIMSAVVAALFWHLKELTPNRMLWCAATAMSVLALGTVFVVFTGRTGQLVGISLVSLAIFWGLPKRYRLISIVVPPLIFVLAFVSFESVSSRFNQIEVDVAAYSSGIGSATSADNRLDFWRGSLDAIVDHPLAGTGVGSWATEYNNIERSKYPTHKDLHVGSNPHQEFLLWGVQLGVGGILLLFAFIGAALIDLRKMEQPIARAGQSVLVALVVSCMFNSTLYDAYIGDFFCLALGVLLAYGHRARNVATPG